MTMQTRSFLAVALAAFALACADTTSPTQKAAPNAPSATITSQDFFFPPGFPDGLLSGRVRLCKTANHEGTFSFNVTTNGTGTLLQGANPTIDIPSGGGTVCKDVYASTRSITIVEDVVITEGADPAPEWDLTAINTIQFFASGPLQGNNYPAGAFQDAEDFANRKVTLKINADMSRKTTFTNTFTVIEQPPSGCTYTKGWYQNKNGAPTVIGVDGRSKSEAQAIFAATPGKPNGVTFGGNNLLLNVYQQLLAALNNLGGDAHANDGPPAVDAAIALALSGTGGTGLNITTTLTQQQLGDLATTLANFNEGKFEGWPHCADQVID